MITPIDTSSSSISLRQATPDDALCLSVLAMQVFLDTYATAGIRSALAREVLRTYSESAFSDAISTSSNCITIAERDGHLVGFAQVTLGECNNLAPSGVQAELLRLYVQEPFTGAHIGTQLLRQAECTAAQAGVSVLWLTFWVHNQRARSFYARRGYKDFGATQFVFEGESHENRLVAKFITQNAA